MVYQQKTRFLYEDLAVWDNDRLLSLKQDMNDTIKARGNLVWCCGIIADIDGIISIRKKLGMYENWN